MLMAYRLGFDLAGTEWGASAHDQSQPIGEQGHATIAGLSKITQFFACINRRKAMTPDALSSISARPLVGPTPEPHRGSFWQNMRQACSPDGAQRNPGTARPRIALRSMRATKLRSSIRSQFWRMANNRLFA